MRRFLVALFFAMLAVFCVSARAEFIMPASLTTIGDEAFSGTGADEVILGNKVAFIGDYSFAKMKSLKSIYIPPFTQFIGEHAFEGCVDIEIHGEYGTYAQKWAERHNIAFIDTSSASRTANAKVVKPELLSEAVTEEPELGDKFNDAKKDIHLSCRYTELHPIEYDFP